MPFEHQENCQRCKNRFSNVFCSPENDMVPGLKKEKVCTSYKKGEYIFKEGTWPHGIFCLNRGKVKLTKIGDDGKEQIVRLIKPGGPMGYRALFSSDKYSASAIAIEESGVCFIPKELFMSILTKDSQLTLEIIKLLSDDLKKAEDQLLHIAQKPVRERIAEALIFIKETYGFEDDGLTINMAISRDDLANIVGTSTESAIRLLSDLNKEKVIELVGKKIKILNQPKLLQIANLFD